MLYVFWAEMEACFREDMIWRSFVNGYRMSVEELINGMIKVETCFRISKSVVDVTLVNETHDACYSAFNLLAWGGGIESVKGFYMKRFDELHNTQKRVKAVATTHG